MTSICTTNSNGSQGWHTDTTVQKELESGGVLVCYPGTLHREDGPAKVDTNVESEQWYLYGERHRVGGPAIIFEGGVANGGSEYWYVDGVMHREDGPASIWKGGAANGGKEAWYINGRVLYGLKLVEYLANRNLSCLG